MDIKKLKYKSLLFVSSDNNEELHKLLNDTFREVVVETNFEASVHTYFGDNRTSDKEIDIVLYDVNASNVTYLQQIRELNKKMPLFVISDDYNGIDTHKLLEQRIYFSLSKPLNIELLAKEAYYALKEVSKRKFNAYLRKVAIVSKTDNKGKIIYVNELFASVSGYSKEELMDQPHSIIRDPANPKSLYQNLWTTIQSGKTWHGIIKNRSKDNQEYYINSTIFPTFNSKKEIIGYLSIAFIVTTEEKNKAKLKHYIMSQKSAQIKSNQELDHKIQEHVDEALLKEQARYEELRKIAVELEDSLQQAKINKKQLAARVHYLEDTLKTITKRDKESDTKLKLQLRESRQENYETHKKNEKLEKSNEILTEKLDRAQESIQVFQGYIDDYRKKIDDLNDVIASNEKDLSKYQTPSE